MVSVTEYLSLNQGAVVNMLLIVLLAVSGCWALYRGRKYLATLGATIEQLRGQLQKTQRAALTLQSQLQQLQQQNRSIVQKLEDTASRQQELEFRDMGQLTYTHASKLVQMGAGSADLISACGLSPAEARLLELMHKRAHEIEQAEDPASRDAA
jgi:hypothetical protein